MVTRWGTWLESSFYFLDNFDNVKVFIDQLKNEKNSAIILAKKLVNDPVLKQQLLSMHSFRFLPEKIKYLESNFLSKQQQFQVIQGVKEKLSGFALKKLEKSRNFLISMNL